MIKLIDILNEVTGDTFQMYHGGNKWITPPEIRPSKNGRYEGGVGIYLKQIRSRAPGSAKPLVVRPKTLIETSSRPQYENILHRTHRE